MGNLEGKVALITGAGSGIGLATAKTFAARGARVMLSDIKQDAAADGAAAIREKGGVAAAIACDIGQEEDIKRAVAHTVAQFGRLDILHNNAALASTELLATDTDILTVPVSTWDSIMAVTLRGTMLGCKYGVEAMLKTGGGVIINTSSMYGVSPPLIMLTYSTAKAAINMLTRHVATTHGRSGIRCNAVAPSLVKTPGSDSVIPKAFADVHNNATALPFSPTPEDVANAVAFLASEDARFITGEIMHVDGGSTSHLATYVEARRLFGG